MADLQKERPNYLLLDKSISAAHATATSIAAFLLLRYGWWPIPEATETAPQQVKHGGQHLDDSRNPTIHGRNRLANALTAWETAYLIYDTYALVRASRSRSNIPSNSAALCQVAKDSPVALVHHVLLASALLVLHGFIAAGKEKGIWVITAFLLMNSSTPLMHARWWSHRRYGKPNAALDVAFLANFAAARFGVVVWVLREYGRYHGIGAWQAYGLLKRRCQVGTAMLVGMNGLWWSLLAFNILKRSLRRKIS
jgi:hypothetical protein